MKFASVPLALMTAASLLVLGGCSTSSSESEIILSDPRVSIWLDGAETQTSISVNEDVGSLPIFVSFSEGLIEPLTLSFSTSGSATEGGDYVLDGLGEPIEVQPSDLTGGQVELDGFIKILNNTEPGDDGRQLILTLSKVSYGRRQTPVTLTITINNDGDVATKPTSN